VERSVKGELDRAVSVMRSHGFDLRLPAPASAQDVTAAERQTGIKFDDDFREYFNACNGSNELAAAVMTDELTPCVLASLQECVEQWSQWLPYDAAVQKMFGDPEPHDPRIKARLVNRLWFPLAEFNGWSTTVFFDGDPGLGGRVGQIIVYQHDPDAMYYVAPTFGEFLALSNDFIMRHATELLLLDGDPVAAAPPRIGAL